MIRAIAALQLVVVLLILAAACLYGVAYVGLRFDDASYHIPAAVRIAKHLDPYFVASPVDAHWYPAGAETAVALLVLLAGSLYVTNLSGAACFIALEILTFRFAGLWSRDLAPRLASVACVAAVPLLLGQSLAFYVDIHLALAVCLGLYWLCRSLIDAAGRWAYYALAMAILSASIKYSGLYYLLFLAPAAAYCLWRAEPPRRPGPGAVAALVIATGFSAGWYMRNWVLRGNPFFPVPLPAPLATLLGAGYDFDPTFVNLSPTTSLPHPLLPLRWLAHEAGPAMTADGFGTSTVIAIACVLFSLLGVRRLESRRRQAWVLLVVLGVAMVAAFPTGLTIPRYVLFAPVVAALGPTVLWSVTSPGRARAALRLLVLGILLFTGAYAYANLLAPGSGVTRLRTALARLHPYRPLGIKRYAYVDRGGLRIGYTSGFGNYVAMLYDADLTNTLIPLHYRNYPYNHWRELDSPEDLVAGVRSLDLDYIHVFDPRYPGVDILARHFPAKICPRGMLKAILDNASK